MSKDSHRYMGRLYINKSDVDIIKDSLTDGQNVMLLGPRGTGKSTLAKTVAAVMGREFRYIPCHTGATSENLIGQWIPNPTGAGYIWMDGILTVCVRKGYICLLDEINSLKPEVCFVIHGLLDSRRELVLTEKPGPDGEPETIKAHPNFGLIAAGNPNYEGVRVMNEAFVDRFAVQLLLDYKGELDIKIIKSYEDTKKISVQDVSAVCAFVEKIRAAASPQVKAIFSDVSTRMFLDLVSNIGNHGLRVAKQLTLYRFQDPNEQSAVRMAFDECWNKDGTPKNFAPAGPKPGSKFATAQGPINDQNVANKI